MKIISPSVEILTKLDGEDVLKRIEQCGRVCYKSEDKITDASAYSLFAGNPALHEAPMHIPHKCKDGSAGLAYFAGFLKEDNQ